MLLQTLRGNRLVLNGILQTANHYVPASKSYIQISVDVSGTQRWFEWPCACSDIHATPPFDQAYIQRYKPSESPDTPGQVSCLRACRTQLLAPPRKSVSQRRVVTHAGHAECYSPPSPPLPPSPPSPTCAPRDVQTLGYHYDARAAYCELIAGVTICGRGRLLLSPTQGSEALDLAKLGRENAAQVPQVIPPATAAACATDALPLAAARCRSLPLLHTVRDSSEMHLPIAPAGDIGAPLPLRAQWDVALRSAPRGAPGRAG